MKRYRSKPAVVDAVRWDGNNLQEVARWAGVVGCGDVIQYTGYHDVGVFLAVPTPEGLAAVAPGDYIVKGRGRELYPCQGEVFGETYEEVGG